MSDETSKAEAKNEKLKSFFYKHRAIGRIVQEIYDQEDSDRCTFAEVLNSLKKLIQEAEETTK